MIREKKDCDIMNETINYYDKNADRFIEGTINADMSKIQSEFLAYIPENGSILDFGCGSGRDSKSFLDKGYKVLSVDGSAEMCKAAEQLTGQKTIHCLFQDFTWDEKFDGIWACASLLHLSKDEIGPVLDTLSGLLKENGCLYVSFKYGDFSGNRSGRFFTDLTESSLGPIVEQIPGIKLIKYEITEDVRPDRAEKWLNAFYTGVENG